MRTVNELPVRTPVTGTLRTEFNRLARQTTMESLGHRQTRWPATVRIDAQQRTEPNSTIRWYTN
jgi:hypothetical protein